MSTATPSDDHAPNHPDRTESEWVARFDDKLRPSEVTFVPRDVDPEKLSTEWITVELGHGLIVDVEGWQ